MTKKGCAARTVPVGPRFTRLKKVQLEPGFARDGVVERESALEMATLVRRARTRLGLQVPSVRSAGQLRMRRTSAVVE